VFVAVAVGLALLPFGVAAADVERIEFTDVFAYEDVHPCTGVPRTVDAVYSVSIKEHQNGATIVIDMRESASDGSVTKGIQVINDNHRRGFYRGMFAFNSVDPEGNRLIGHAKWRVDAETGIDVETRHYVCPGNNY